MWSIISSVVENLKLLKYGIVTVIFAKGWECYASPHLSLTVDTNDATGGLVGGGDEDGVATDAVHEDTSATLNVIQMNIPILGDEVYYIMLRAHLEIRYIV